MATHDPIDLHDRSQAFHKDFFNYHLKNDKPWFIKDAKSCYVTANRAFFDLHGLSHSITIEGMSDKDLPFMKFCVLRSNYLYEMDVLTSRDEIKTLEINFFNEDDYLTPRILTRDLLPLSNGSVVIYGEIETIQNDYSRIFILNELEMSGCDRGYDVSRVMEVMDSVKNTNPLSELTKREWEIAWLVLNGFSYAKIAMVMEITTDYVEKRTKNIYSKLGVLYQSAFYLIGHSLGWVNYFPERFIKEPKSILINHCIKNQPAMPRISLKLNS